jgi:ATP-dependent helicase YprA (DUF1998 family)
MSIKEILEKLGLYFFYYKEDKQEEEKSDISFSEILPNISNIRFSNFKMYKHQEEAIKYLIKSKNLIINTKTRSGKTEIWTFYAISKFIILFN